MTPAAQIQTLTIALPRTAGERATWIASVCGVSRVTAYRWLAMDPADPKRLHRVPPPTQEHADRVRAAVHALFSRVVSGA